MKITLYQREIIKVSTRIRFAVHTYLTQRATVNINEMSIDRYAINCFESSVTTTHLSLCSYATIKMKTNYIRPQSLTV